MYAARLGPHLIVCLPLGFSLPNAEPPHSPTLLQGGARRQRVAGFDFNVAGVQAQDGDTHVKTEEKETFCQNFLRWYRHPVA